MAKVYSVDAALEKHKPYIELRGEIYEVRDLTMRERLEKIIEFQEKQKEKEEAVEEGEERQPNFEDVQDVIAEAIQEALIGVPDEVAKSVTESEWKALQDAITQAQQDNFPVEVEERDDVEGNAQGK